MAHARQYRLRDLWACGSLGCPHGGTAGQHRGSRSYTEQLSRTLDAASTPVEHMGIDHRRTDVLVTEQFLHGADVIPRFEYMGCKGMTQGMTRGWFRDACLANRHMHSPLEHLLVGMVRLTMPVRGSRDNLAAGNTYCHTQARFAWGYLRSRAYGR